jgi:hypothetical protein
MKGQGHMNPKLKKVNAEIDKMEARLTETQETLKNLRTEKKMLEDLEIVKAIRSMNTGNMDVLELVAQMQMSRDVKPSAFSVPENKITTNMEEKENE